MAFFADSVSAVLAIVFILCLSDSKSSVESSSCGTSADLDTEGKIFMRQSGRGECPTSE